MYNSLLITTASHAKFRVLNFEILLSVVIASMLVQWYT